VSEGVQEAIETGTREVRMADAKGGGSQRKG